MRKIELKGKCVGVVHTSSEWKEGLDFLTPNEAFIQAGTWWYNSGKLLQAHVHTHYSREVLQTQETIVVLSGRLRIDFYDDAGFIFCPEVLSSGDVCVILDVGHGYEILDDNTKIVEVKNGPFISVEKDKRLLK